jgi:hypothetical protein
MDLGKALQLLYTEKEKLERTIATLQELDRTDATMLSARKKRGRHSMGAAEREEVSERMKRYWAKRRAAQ